jgi:hypothetical protein
VHPLGDLLRHDLRIEFLHGDEWSPTKTNREREHPLLHPQ